MPLRMVRNDIIKMNTEAIVNTANEFPTVGPGCDSAVYKAAGYNKLLDYRKEKIGYVPTGDAFITPGFGLMARYIIHAVSPKYVEGDAGMEEKLRSCYRKCLNLARENGIKSIAFPLISTGTYGYPREDGLRIAVDEINSFLHGCDMVIFVVVFDTKSTQLAEKIYPKLEAYIDHNYVCDARELEYGIRDFGSYKSDKPGYDEYMDGVRRMDERLIRRAEAAKQKQTGLFGVAKAKYEKAVFNEDANACMESAEVDYVEKTCRGTADEPWDENTILAMEEKLKERLAHREDTFAEYLLYLIKSRKMTNVEVYKRAFLTKQYFHKLNKNKDFHPEKIKALLLCVGAKLTLDETKDLLARAGYALSPADLTDIIFSFFIEEGHYDVVDIDIQLEAYGLPCIIS